MVTADMLAVVFSLLGLFLAVPGFLLVWRALAPGHAAGTTQRFHATPGRTLLVGAGALVVALPPLALVGVDVGPVRLLGVWWAAAVLGVSLGGLQGLAGRVGETLAGPGDAARPWAPILKGAIALELACLVPVLGWFLLLPLLLVAGLGASLLAWAWPHGGARAAAQALREVGAGRS